MKFFLGLVSFLVLVGCGATRLDRRVVNTPSGRDFEQCSKDRVGDQDCIRQIDSQVDIPGAIGGGAYGGYGRGLGYDSYPPAQTPVYMSGPIVTDGQRAMENIQSGPVVLELGYGSANGSGPATGGSVPCSSAGGCVTTAQGAAIVRKVQQLDHRVETLEGTVPSSKK